AFHAAVSALALPSIRAECSFLWPQYGAPALHPLCRSACDSLAGNSPFCFYSRSRQDESNNTAGLSLFSGAYSVRPMAAHFPQADEGELERAAGTSRANRLGKRSIISADSDQCQLGVVRFALRREPGDTPYPA